MTQPQGESLREYITRFGKEALDIPNLDITTAIQAFKMGLQRDSTFYQELVMNPCRKLDEVKNRALRFIRHEDDKKIQERIKSSSRYNHPNRKSTPTYEPNKHKPYARPDNKRVNVVEDDG